MGNFKNLPTDIVLDIITRLPAESILDCKLVCKPWRNLVSHHPSFYQTYLTHLNHSTADFGKLSFLVFSMHTYKLHHFDLDEKHYDEETPTHRTRRINFTLPFVCHVCRVIGSINGLVCLYGCNDNAVCVCNPVTREYVMLPKIYRKLPQDHYVDVYLSCGFGYLPTTNEYKVVVLNTLEVEVYTLGSDNGWRTVDTLGIQLGEVSLEFERGVFVNGAVHWRDKRGGRVLAFDLTKEKFSELLSPPPCPSILREPSAFAIGVFGGVLYYATSRNCEITKRRWCDIWLLKKKTDIGDMEELVEHEPLGWSKEFSIPGSPRIDEPLAFTKSGSILYFNTRSPNIYDAVASTSKTLVDFTYYIGLSNRIFPHKITLLSLKELGEENVQVMQAANIEEAETPLF